MKKIGLLIAAFLTTLFICAALTIQWIDSKSIPAIENSRSKVNLIFSFYQFIPVYDKEKNITRTLKFANLIAMAEINNKALNLVATDFVNSYQTIKKLSTYQKKIPDAEASHELSVHLMVIANRMIAIGIAGNKRFEQFEQEVDYQAERISNDAFSTPELKAVAIRERELKRSMLSGMSFTRTKLQHFSDEIEMADRFYEGLGMCIGGNQSGASAIRLSLTHYTNNRTKLIYQISRNMDFPLIAVSGKEEDSLCQAASNEAINLIRRN